MGVSRTFLWCDWRSKCNPPPVQDLYNRMYRVNTVDGSHPLVVVEQNALLYIVSGNRCHHVLDSILLSIMVPYISIDIEQDGIKSDVDIKVETHGKMIVAIYQSCETKSVPFGIIDECQIFRDMIVEFTRKINTTEERKWLSTGDGRKKPGIKTHLVKKEWNG